MCIAPIAMHVVLSPATAPAPGVRDPTTSDAPDATAATPSSHVPAPESADAAGYASSLRRGGTANHRPQEEQTGTGPAAGERAEEALQSVTSWSMAFDPFERLPQGS